MRLGTFEACCCGAEKGRGGVGGAWGRRVGVGVGVGVTGAEEEDGELGCGGRGGGVWK